MRTSAPIISRQALPGLPAQIGWRMLATLMWGIWLSCWGPLVTLAIWELGLYQINSAFVIANGFAQPQRIALPCLPIILAQSACLLGWAGKDYLLFGRLQRRSQAPAVDLTELARYGQVSQADLVRWQSARCVVAEHDDHGCFQFARIIHSSGRRRPVSGLLPRALPMPEPLRLPLEGFIDAAADLALVNDRPIVRQHGRQAELDAFSDQRVTN